jgi:7-keto-8-aminopelargonate synthetase-like enzyme
LNVAASRLTTGNHALYLELEAELRDFFGAEDALLVPSGYVTDLVVGQALAGQFSHALIDDHAHPALADAARFLDCPVLRFKSRDPADVASAVRRCGPGSKPVLLTDGMFSHNGSAAPLRQYLEVLPQDGWIVVDDAHGATVLGATGKGTLEAAGVPRRRILQTVTLSKGIGTYGGAILGPKSFRKTVLQRSRLFIGSTPLALPLAAAAIESIRILKRGPAFRRRLSANAMRVKTALKGAGLPMPDHPGPIVPLVPKNARVSRALKEGLLAAKILPPHIVYPGSPANGYFRFVISSEHTPQQLERLTEVLCRFIGKFGPESFAVR